MLYLFEDVEDEMDQNILENIDLSRNNFKDRGLQAVCSTLPFLSQLKSLNLSQNNLTVAGIKCLSQLFLHSQKDLLVNLTDLNLSYNNFSANILTHLGIITKHLKLRLLNIRECNLPENIFDNFDDIVINLQYIEYFDLSLNDLNSKDICKLLSFVNFGTIKNLNVSGNSNITETGIVKAIAEKLSKQKSNNLVAMNFSKCMVNDLEILELLRFIKNIDLEFIKLESNCDLTAISLGYLLHHRPSFVCISLRGCTNILKNFRYSIMMTDTKSLTYDTNNLKCLYLSIDNSTEFKEVNCLVEIWKKQWGEKARMMKIRDKMLYLLVENWI